jgi:predicted Na+-dependent transporter
VLAALFGRRFWIVAYLLLGLGFVVPGDWRLLEPTIPVLLGGILYFSCLKVTLGEMATAARDLRTWLRIGWLTVAKMLVLPLVSYAATLVIAPAWAQGVLLTGMMPAAFSSMAFADLYQGSRLTALLLVIVTSLCVPLSAPLLLAWSGGGTVSFTVAGHEAAYIALLLLVPFALAQLTRLVFPVTVARHFASWGQGSIACICVLVFVAVVVNRPSWAHLPATQLLLPLLLVTLTTLIYAGGAWLVSRPLPRADAVAFICTAVYMNNGLAVAFATRFHAGDAHMLLPAILTQVPMMAAVAVLGWFTARRPQSTAA